MPTNHGLGANDMECLAPPGPPPREPHPEGAVEGPEPRSLRAVAEQGELLPERQILKRKISVGPERSTRRAQESEYEGHCAPASLGVIPSSSVTIEFWQTTVGTEEECALRNRPQRLPPGPGWQEIGRDRRNPVDLP